MPRPLTRFFPGLLLWALVPRLVLALAVPVKLQWVDASNNQIAIQAQASGEFHWIKATTAPFVPSVELNVEIPKRLRLLNASVPTDPKKAAQKTSTDTQLLSFKTISPLASFRFSQTVNGKSQNIGLVIQLEAFTKEPLLHKSCRDAGLSITTVTNHARFLFASLSCLNTTEETRVFINTSEDAYIRSSSDKKQTQSFRIRRDNRRRVFEKTIHIVDKSTGNDSAFSIAYDSNHGTLFFLSGAAGPALVLASNGTQSQAGLTLRARMQLEARFSNKVSALGIAHLDLLSFAPTVAFPASFGMIAFMPALQFRFESLSAYGGFLAGRVLASQGMVSATALGPVLGVLSERFAQKKIQLSAELGMLGTSLGSIGPANPLLKFGLQYFLAETGKWEPWRAELSYRVMALPPTVTSAVTGLHSVFLGLGRSL